MQVAFQAAHDLAFRFTFRNSPLHIVSGALVIVHPHKNDSVQRRIGLSVSASIQPVTFRLARRRRNR